MMRIALLSIAILALATASEAGVLQRNGRLRLEHETEPKMNDWVRGPRVSSRTVHQLKIALRTRPESIAALDKVITVVSDPDHRLYGQHLSHAALREYVAASPQGIARVQKWLSQSCVHADLLSIKVTLHHDYLLVSLAAGDAEALFGAQLHSYKHAGFSTELIRSHVQYTVPMHLEPDVEYVFGLTDFPPVPNRRTNQGNKGGDQGMNVTPDVITAQYNVTKPTSGTQINGNAGQGVAEFEQAYFYTTDLPIFQAKYNLPEENVTKIVGKNDPSSGYLGEATLDVEYIMATAPYIPTWVVSLGPFDLIAWALNVTSFPDAPKIQSISWGSAETGFPQSTVTKVNSEFMKMAGLGFTVFAASGDDGTGHSGIFRCDSFQPTFPAVCPYVTAVGGTYVDTQGGTESGWEKSGGGFSAIFPRPSWQDAAVTAYLSTPNLPEQKWWNASGRGIPDVSALATNYQVVIEKSVGPLSGTSAATPTFAAIISIIQNIRLNNGKSPFGFLNPLLYKLKSVGYDVTSGENRSSPCSKGFSAATGWDAITGLGTPIYDVLLNGLS